MNWRGRPLESHEVIVNTIAAATTRTGLTVHAELDTRNYPKGIKITDQQMEGLEQRALHSHNFHGEWNYTLVSQRTHVLRVSQDDDDGVMRVGDDPIRRTTPLGVLSGAVVGVVTALPSG
jgi:hypothetical protein